MDAGPEKFRDALRTQFLKRRGRHIVLKSAAAAALLTAVFFFVSRSF
jgi:hypothetical protein